MKNEPLIWTSVKWIRHVSVVEIVDVEDDGIAGIQQTSVVRQEAIGHPTSGVFEHDVSWFEFIVFSSKILSPIQNPLFLVSCRLSRRRSRLNRRRRIEFPVKRRFITEVEFQHNVC